MTFWGVEMKPGKPFTLKYGDLDGKLILTQATLGTGSSTKKSILQCNVGDKSPVFLCTLLPEKSECCSLTLEFDEEDDVKFSVVGPTSIHLSGFVQGDPQDSYGDGCEDDCCGEDITETESEESDYDSEDDSEDDFIDDDGMTMYPPSHVRNSGVVIEVIEDDEKAPCEKGKTKQPKKKNKLSESNNDQKALVVKGDASILESEDEDGFPISSSCRNEPSSEKHDTQRAGEDGKKNKKGYNAKDDDEGAKNLKRKVDVIDHDEEPKRKAGQEKDSAGATDVPSDEIVNKKKKKKKAKAQETDAIEGDTVAKNKNADNAGSPKSENVQNGDSTDAADAVTGDATKKKKNIKKKKTEKTENGEAGAITEQDAGTEAQKMSVTDKGAKQSKAKSPKVRTFPNGFIVEELQMGKPNGKRASRGSKVSVHYIGKLQKNGKQFDSNIGRAPFKFRLGVGQVIKGWDVGVEGMRIGDKRRLIVPPSMGYGQNGAPPQIPSNAWLVFDVELIDVA